MAMAMAATSTGVMPSQQPVLNHRAHSIVDRTSCASPNCWTRPGLLAVNGMLWKPTPQGFGRRNSVIVAVEGARLNEEREKKGIEIGGEEEPEISGILDAPDGEKEVAILLEPPAGSIDEGYVEALDDGSLDGAGSEEQYEFDEDVEDLKQQLIGTLYGTQRGLRASSDSRAEIIELISQLEAKNPTPAPNEALSLLGGKWILAYTSYSELYPLLAAGNLPLITVGEISQTINVQALTLENNVSFEGPLTSTSFSASASFEIRSPKRVQVKFEEGIIGAPKLTESMGLPSSVDVFGQSIDLTPARGLLQPLQEVASSVARTLSGQPPLKFPIQTDRAQSWLLTTFLDEDLRISRGMVAAYSSLLEKGVHCYIEQLVAIASTRFGCCNSLSSTSWTRLFSL